MWVKKKDFEALAAENVKLKQSIDDLIQSFQQTIEIRQTTDSQNTVNLAALKEIALNNATSAADISQAIIMINQSIAHLSSGLITISKRVKELEDFHHLNNKWTDLAKIQN